jgi:hypothetical protein
MFIEVITNCINCSDNTALLKVDDFGYLAACEGVDVIDAKLQQDGTVDFFSYINQTILPFRMYNNVWMRNCSFIASSPVIRLKVENIDNEIFVLTLGHKYLCLNLHENKFYLYDDIDYSTKFKFLSS